MINPVIRLTIEFVKKETFLFSSSKLIPVVIHTDPTMKLNQSAFNSVVPHKNKNTKPQNIKEPYTFLITLRKGVPKITVSADINTAMLERTDSLVIEPFVNVITH